MQSIDFDNYLKNSNDIIGIIVTESKDVWRITDAFTESIRFLVANHLIFPPAVVGAGMPPSPEGKLHFENMNATAVNANRYVRPSKSVSKLTPIFELIPSPKVIMARFNIPVIVQPDDHPTLIPFVFNIHFECDKDFSEKISGKKLIITWEPQNPKYGLIEMHVRTVFQALSHTIITIARHLDGIGFIGLDQGILELNTPRKDLL